MSRPDLTLQPRLARRAALVNEAQLYTHSADCLARMAAKAAARPDMAGEVEEARALCRTHRIRSMERYAQARALSVLSDGWAGEDDL